MSEWTTELEAIRSHLVRYDVSDAEIRAALTAVVTVLQSRLAGLPVKSDYDNEAWLDKGEVWAALEAATGDRAPATRVR